MQEIECFKIHTHYRKSCSEKWPQRKFFKEVQKTHQQKPKAWVCHGEAHRVFSQPWEAAKPGPCPASAPHPRGHGGPGGSGAPESWHGCSSEHLTVLAAGTETAQVLALCAQVLTPRLHGAGTLQPSPRRISKLRVCRKELKARTVLSQTINSSAG